MKKIVILGSTGSIGRQALDVVRNNPDKFEVIALTCHSNIELMKAQIDEFLPEITAVYDEAKADELRKMTDIEVLSGIEGIINIARYAPAGILLNALVGSIGIKPTIEAINSGKDIALANKETLVTAGDIVMNMVKLKGIKIIPVDSEHSAISQCIQNRSIRDVKKIILTCSGGAFRDKTIAELAHVTVKDALQHPNWSMGSKITIDSATLLNKGLEVIEARHFFDVDYADIEVIIHPQSIIHSLVEFNNSSVVAQLGLPDMRLPIEYALTYPDIIHNNLKSLDLTELQTLNFYKPDLVKYPCLRYAYEAGKRGGSLPCVLNAANEAAVQAFLEGRIKFTDIPRIIQKALDEHLPIDNPELDQILFIDAKTKQDILYNL